MQRIFSKAIFCRHLACCGGRACRLRSIARRGTSPTMIYFSCGWAQASSPIEQDARQNGLKPGDMALRDQLL